MLTAHPPRFLPHPQYSTAGNSPKRTPLGDSRSHHLFPKPAPETPLCPQIVNSSTPNSEHPAPHKTGFLSSPPSLHKFSHPARKSSLKSSRNCSSPKYSSTGTPPSVPAAFYAFSHLCHRNQRELTPKRHTDKPNLEFLHHPKPKPATRKSSSPSNRKDAANR